MGKVDRKEKKEGKEKKAGMEGGLFWKRWETWILFKETTLAMTTLGVVKATGKIDSMNIYNRQYIQLTLLSGGNIPKTWMMIVTVVWAPSSLLHFNPTLAPLQLRHLNPKDPKDSNQVDQPANRRALKVQNQVAIFFRRNKI